MIKFVNNDDYDMQSVEEMKAGQFNNQHDEDDYQQVEDMNANKFTNQNETSYNMPDREMNYNASFKTRGINNRGTHPFDKQDNIKDSGSKMEYTARHQSSNSDAMNTLNNKRKDD